MKKYLQLLALIVTIFIHGDIFAQDNNNHAWLFSGGVGIGFMEETNSNFDTNLALEKLITKKISIGIGFNHMSSYRLIKENSTELIYPDFQELTTNHDFTASMFSIYLIANYNIFTSEKNCFTFGLGSSVNFYQERKIIFSNSPYPNKSNISIIKYGKMYDYPMLVLNLDYTYFINNIAGVNFKLLATEAYGEKIAFLLGGKFKIR